MVGAFEQNSVLRQDFFWRLKLRSAKLDEWY